MTVVTSATIRSSEPHPVASPIDWRQTATILDTDGARLTDCDVRGPPQGKRLLLGDVNEPAALLSYYFGHGGRKVLLSLGNDVIEGWLETRWEGNRRGWWLDLTE
jgi:hypothetical protein